MKTGLKALLVTAAMLPGTAMANDEELKARVAALESMVAELKAELAKQDDVVRLPANYVPEPSKTEKGDGFTVGDTQVRVGGFIDVDAHVTSLSDGAIGSSSIARDFYIPGATPIGGEDQSTTDFTAEASRLFIEGKREVNGETVKGYVEMDFLGSLQGDGRVSNSYSPRLRRAFVSFGNWLAGQEWSTFQNTSAIPESASFLILSDGMVFVRQPQVRYTNGNWQIALENGDTTITDTTGARIEADSNLVPDLVVRYNHTGGYGNVSVAGIARQLRADLPGLEEEDFGYGLSVSGRLKAGARDDIRFNLFGGEGLGRYVGLNAVNGAALDPMTGDLEAIASYGGLVAWRHPFGETARLNIGYSGLWADNPDFAVGSMTKSVQSVYGAVLWDVADRTTVGAELMLGTRENEAGDDGTISRLTLSTKYAF